MKICKQCQQRETSSEQSEYCDDCFAYNFLENDELEDEDWDDFEEMQKEQEWEEKAQYAGDCRCGAWVFDKKGNPIHVADCCCGAE